MDSFHPALLTNREFLFATYLEEDEELDPYDIKPILTAFLINKGYTRESLLSSPPPSLEVLIDICQYVFSQRVMADVKMHMQAFIGVMCGNEASRSAARGVQVDHPKMGVSRSGTGMSNLSEPGGYAYSRGLPEDQAAAIAAHAAAIEAAPPAVSAAEWKEVLSKRTLEQWIYVVLVEVCRDFNREMAADKDARMQWYREGVDGGTRGRIGFWGRMVERFTPGGRRKRMVRRRRRAGQVKPKGNKIAVNPTTFDPRAPAACFVYAAQMSAGLPNKR